MEMRVCGGSLIRGVNSCLQMKESSGDPAAWRAGNKENFFFFHHTRDTFAQSCTCCGLNIRLTSHLSSNISHSNACNCFRCSIFSHYSNIQTDITSEMCGDVHLEGWTLILSCAVFICSSVHVSENLVWFVCSSRFPLFQNIWAFLNVLFQLFPPCRALSIAQCHIILEQTHESENIWGDLAHTFMLKLNTAVILQATHSTGLRMTECSEHQRRQESAFLFPTVKHKLTNSSRVRPEERRGWKYLAGRRYDMIDALQTETRSK